MPSLKDIFNLLRVNQWVKNLFVFIPIFFAGDLLKAGKLVDVFFAFFAFCFVASSIYIVNDLQDLEADRQHPEKLKRPLAAGVVKPQAAKVIFVILLIVGLWLSYQTRSLAFSFVLLSYFVLNISYSLGLKRLSIVEILIVSSGFVLRAVGGGIVANVEVSQWMLMMIFLLAIFLALAKRRDDLLVSKNSDRLIRKSIQFYNLEYINALLIMMAGIIIVSYLMYVISPEVINRFHSKYLYITSIFVIAGVMRYLQITLVENKSGSPTRILYYDNFIRVTVLLWITTFYLIIYQS